MAPSVLFRERGSNNRSEVATGSFTGAAACGAAGVAAGALIVCANPDATQPQTHTKTKRTKMRFIRNLLKLTLPNRRALRGFPQTLTSGRQRRSQQLPEHIPTRDHADRRTAFHFAVACKSNPHEHDAPDDENVQARSHDIEKFVAGAIHKV